MNRISVILEILFYVVFVGLFVKAAKKKDESDESFSKLTSQNLKGLCCLAIFGHHYGQMSGEPLLVLFTHFGYLVLNVFLMISGYGVAYGLKNKKNYLANFLFRRCGKIILCYWIMNGITVIVDFCLFGKVSIGSWQKGINIFFLRDASYTQSSWYMMMLFWLYFSFYLVAHLGEKYLQVFMFLVVTGIIIYNIRKGMPLWYYNYLYSFNVGIYMAYRKKPGKKECFFQKTLCSCVMFIILFVISKIDRIIVVPESEKILLYIAAILSSTVLAVMVMFMIEKIKMESKILCILGGISTSVYVFHTCVMLRPEIQFKMMEYIKNWGLCMWFSVGITIAVGMSIKWLCDKRQIV